MAYVLTLDTSPHRSLKRVARRRLDAALEALGRVDGAAPTDIEEAVHDVRRRCKEVRALAHLVRPALGTKFTSFDDLVRQAANELSSTRDAHAVLDTFDRLRDAQTDVDNVDNGALDRVRARLSADAADATRGIIDGDTRLEAARQLLSRARAEIDDWRLPRGFDPLGRGLGQTYRRGVRSHADVGRTATDESVHEWRKAVKHLWYQIRLLQLSAPSVLGPLVDRLAQLADALGDDHDLAVLIERLEADSAAFSGQAAVAVPVAMARVQQAELRMGAVRLGATIYAESRRAFVERVSRYWAITAADGAELDVGSIEALTSASSRGDVGLARRTGDSSVERERKWLVSDHPELTDGTILRQGYLAIDGSVSVRVRDAGTSGCTLTIKAGHGAVRTELEWRIDRATFDEAWVVAGTRTVSKTRFRIPIGDLTIEVDVFGGTLEGLVMAEVEFSDAASMVEFVPPDWFIREVSDDANYTNASLAVHGLDATRFL